MTPLTDAFELMGLTEMLDRDAGYAVADANGNEIAAEDSRFQDIKRKAVAIFHDRIEQTLTEADRDKLLIINVESGEYELFHDEDEGQRRWLDYRYADPVYLMRVGNAAPFSVGNVVSRETAQL